MNIESSWTVPRRLHLHEISFLYFCSNYGVILKFEQKKRKWNENIFKEHTDNTLKTVIIYMQYEWANIIWNKKKQFCNILFRFEKKK